MKETKNKDDMYFTLKFLDDFKRAKEFKDLDTSYRGYYEKFKNDFFYVNKSESYMKLVTIETLDWVFDKPYCGFSGVIHLDHKVISDCFLKVFFSLYPCWEKSGCWHTINKIFRCSLPKELIEDVASIYPLAHSC